MVVEVESRREIAADWDPFSRPNPWIGVAAHRSRLQRDGLGGCGGGMLDLQSGDRIELFYEDAPAKTIRATVGRLLTHKDEGIGIVNAMAALTKSKPI